MSDLYKSMPKTLSKKIKDSGKRIGEEMKNTMPYYYHKGGMDVIDFSKLKMPEEQVIGFCRINVMKYLTRYPDKNGVEDLKKAREYLDKLIELEGKL